MSDKVVLNGLISVFEQFSCISWKGQESFSDGTVRQSGSGVKHKQTSSLGKI